QHQGRPAVAAFDGDIEQAPVGVDHRHVGILVMRGPKREVRLRPDDPRIHLKRIYSRRWIAGSSPATTSGLLFVQRSEQSIDQGLRDALVSHRLEQFCELLRAKMRSDLRL